MIKFFWMPVQVWYYVVIPILAILLIYFFFTVFYRKKKGTLYYDYVVDYVYSTLGILFCSLLLCLLLGYSTATLQVILQTGLLRNYLFLVIVLAILPLVPFAFLIYVIRIYLKNVKRKAQLEEEKLLQTEEVKEEKTSLDKEEKVVESFDSNKNMETSDVFVEPELKKLK